MQVERAFNRRRNCTAPKNKSGLQLATSGDERLVQLDVAVTRGEAKNCGSQVAEGAGTWKRCVQKGCRLEGEASGIVTSRDRKK